MDHCILVYGQYKIGNGDFDLQRVIGPMSSAEAATYCANTLKASPTGKDRTWYDAGSNGDTRFKYVVTKMDAPR